MKGKNEFSAHEFILYILTKIVLNRHKHTYCVFKDRAVEF